MPIYVDSTAAGANNGTSWTDAYVTIASTTSVAAGSEILVAHNHDETAASYTLNWSNGIVANPVQIICVNSSSGALATTAIVRTTAADSATHSLVIQGSIYVYGIIWKASSSITLATGTSRSQSYEQSKFVWLWDRGSNTNFDIGLNNPGIQFLQMSDCTVDQSVRSAWKELNIRRPESVVINRITIVPAATTNGTFVKSGGSGRSALVLVNSDISQFSTLVQVGGFLNAKFKKCKLKASYALTTGTIDHEDFVITESCTDGTITIPPLGLNKFASYCGTITSDTAVWRTDGADDGLQANAYSWNMASNANAKEIYSALESPPLAIWIDPDATPSGATAKGLFQSTRMAPLGTPTALTTDSGSTWNGTGVGTKQKIDVTVGDYTLTVYVASGVTLNDDDFWIEVSAPDQIGGPITVKCFLAVPSTTVYVDPQIVIDGNGGGNEMFADGIQVTFPETATGGGGGGDLIGGRLVK